MGLGGLEVAVLHSVEGPAILLEVDVGLLWNALRPSVIPPYSEIDRSAIYAAMNRLLDGERPIDFQDIRDTYGGTIKHIVNGALQLISSKEYLIGRGRISRKDGGIRKAVSNLLHYGVIIGTAPEKELEQTEPPSGDTAVYVQGRYKSLPPITVLPEVAADFMREHSLK